jgi:hypothetical protein
LDGLKSAQDPRTVEQIRPAAIGYYQPDTSCSTGAVPIDSQPKSSEKTGFFTTDPLGTYHRRAVWVLHLDPIPRRSGPVWRREPLRHDPLQPELAGVPEHGGAGLRLCARSGRSRSVCGRPAAPASACARRAVTIGSVGYPGLPSPACHPGLPSPSIHAASWCSIMRELPAGPAVVPPVNGSVSADGRQYHPKLAAFRFTFGARHPNRSHVKLPREDKHESM